MKHIWRVRKLEPGMCEQLAGSLDISKILAQLLINRGFTGGDEARQFLAVDRRTLVDPFRFREMGAAVGRIRMAIARREKIMLYGDYDVDGITGAALMHFCLTRLKANFFTYIPHRIKEGYGLHDEPIRLARLQGVKLMLTIDCGTSEAKRIRWARKLGIDAIVVDHHEPKDDYPDAAYCVINPKVPGETYPFRDLTSVGLAFKLASALIDSASAAEHLDLVALGTVSDVAPLVGENRVLVRHGLQIIQHTEKAGLDRLLKVAGIAGRELTSDHLGFMLGPRINASGRMGSGYRAFKMLTTDDPEEAERLARELDNENRARQVLERRILNEAVDKVEGEFNFKTGRIIVVWDERWHLGVVGIVAARLAERYHRPAVVIALEGDTGRGSGRSAGGFQLFDAVHASSDCLVKFGGHAQAIGLEIRREKLHAFREKLNQVVADTFDTAKLEPVLDVDLELGLQALDSRVMDDLTRLAPYGAANPRPLFLARGLTVKQDAVRIGREGIKFWVEGGGVTREGIGFRHRHLLPIVKKGSQVDLVFTPEVRSWEGRETLQLVLRSLRRS